MSEQPVVENVVDTKASPFKEIQEHPDRYLMGLAIAPLLSALLVLLIGGGGVTGLLLFVIPTIAFALLDEREMKRTNRHAPEHWSVFVVPIYIWQRLKLNSQDLKWLYVWVGAFVFSMLVAMQADSDALASQSCDLVTQIISENVGSGAECVGVTIDKEVKDGFYKGTATLNNGNDVGITIDTTKDGQIYVQIVN